MDHKKFKRIEDNDSINEDEEMIFEEITDPFKLLE